MTDRITIVKIKDAVDAGMTVTLADNSNYTVIKGKTGQYLIQYAVAGHPQNWIGLHGMKGTKYEHQINMRGAWNVSGTIEGDNDNA